MFLERKLCWLKQHTPSDGGNGCKMKSLACRRTKERRKEDREKI
jgi:hypothetical protein